MKSTTTLSLVICFLSSCSSIYFHEIQPKGGERLSEIPKELHGTWYSDSEGWKIDEEGFTNIDFRKDTLNNIIDTVYKTTLLSDSTRIYRAKDYFFLNYRENTDYWEVIVIAPQKHSDINFFLLSDPEICHNIRGIQLEKANYSIDGELQSFHEIKEDFEGEHEVRFESAIFLGQMNVRSLKKALKRAKPTIFAKNGLIYSPNEIDSISPPTSLSR